MDGPWRRPRIICAVATAWLGSYQEIPYVVISGLHEMNPFTYLVLSLFSVSAYSVLNAHPVTLPIGEWSRETSLGACNLMVGDE